MPSEGAWCIPFLVRLWEREELLAELVPAMGARGDGEGCAGRVNAQPIRHLESLCGAQVSYRLVCTVPGDEPRTRWSDPCRMLDMDFAESPFYEGR